MDETPTTIQVKDGKATYTIDSNQTTSGTYIVTATYSDEGEHGLHHYKSSSVQNTIIVSKNVATLKILNNDGNEVIGTPQCDVFSPITFNLQVLLNETPVKGAIISGTVQNASGDYVNTITMNGTQYTIQNGVTDSNGKVTFATSIPMNPDYLRINKINDSWTVQFKFKVVSPNGEFSEIIQTQQVLATKRDIDITYLSDKSISYVNNGSYTFKAQIVDRKGEGQYLSYLQNNIKIACDNKDIVSGITSTISGGKLNIEVPCTLTYGTHTFNLNIGKGNDIYKEVNPQRYTMYVRKPITCTSSESPIQFSGTSSKTFNLTMKTNNGILLKNLGGFRIDIFSGQTNIKSYINQTTDNNGIIPVTYTPTNNDPKELKIKVTRVVDDYYESLLRYIDAKHQLNTLLSGNITFTDLKFNQTTTFKGTIVDYMDNPVPNVQYKIYLKSLTENKTYPLINVNENIKTDTDGKFNVSYQYTNNNLDDGKFTLVMETISNTDYLSSKFTDTIYVMGLPLVTTSYTDEEGVTHGIASSYDESYDPNSSHNMIKDIITLPAKESKMNICGKIYRNDKTDSGNTFKNGCILSEVKFIDKNNPDQSTVVATDIEVGSDGIFNIPYVIPCGFYDKTVKIVCTVFQNKDDTNKRYNIWGSNGVKEVKIRRYCALTCGVNKFSLTDTNSVSGTAIDTHGDAVSKIQGVLYTTESPAQNITLFQNITSTLDGSWDGSQDTSNQLNLPYRTKQFALENNWFFKAMTTDTTNYVNNGQIQNDVYITSTISPLVELYDGTTKTWVAPNSRWVTEGANVGIRIAYTYPRFNPSANELQQKKIVNFAIKIMNGGNAFINGTSSDGGSNTYNPTWITDSNGYIIRNSSNPWIVPTDTITPEVLVRVEPDWDKMPASTKQLYQKLFERFSIGSYTFNITNKVAIGTTNNDIVVVNGVERNIPSFYANESITLTGQLRDVADNLLPNVPISYFRIKKVGDTTLYTLRNQNGIISTTTDDGGNYNFTWDRTIQKSDGTLQTITLDGNSVYNIIPYFSSQGYMNSNGADIYIKAIPADNVKVTCISNTQKDDKDIIFQTRVTDKDGNGINGLNVTMTFEDKPNDAPLNLTTATIDGKTGMVQATRTIKYDKNSSTGNKYKFTTKLLAQVYNGKQYTAMQVSGIVTVKSSIEFVKLLYNNSTNDASISGNNDENYTLKTVAVDSTNIGVPNLDGFMLYNKTTGQYEDGPVTSNSNGEVSLKIYSKDCAWFENVYQVINTKYNPTAPSPTFTFSLKHVLTMDTNQSLYCRNGGTLFHGFRVYDKSLGGLNSLQGTYTGSDGVPNQSITTVGIQVALTLTKVGSTTEIPMYPTSVYPSAQTYKDSKILTVYDGGASWGALIGKSGTSDRNWKSTSIPTPRPGTYNVNAYVVPWSLTSAEQKRCATKIVCNRQIVIQ